MKKSLRVACLLLLAAIIATAASAQSPRADISWLAGGHISPISSVAYSPDGRGLASSGYFGDTLKLWNASDGRMVRTFGNTVGSSFIFGPMVPITFLPDGHTIIAIGEGAAIGSTRPAMSWRGVKWSGFGLMPSGARIWQVSVNQAVWAADL